MANDQKLDNESLKDVEVDDQAGGSRFSRIPMYVLLVIGIVVGVVAVHGIRASGITSQSATSAIDDGDEAQDRARLKALEGVPAPVPAMVAAAPPPMVLPPAQSTMPARIPRTPSPDEQWKHEQLMLARQAPPMMKEVHDHSTLELSQAKPISPSEIGSGTSVTPSVSIHPASPYSIMAGSIIPAILVSGIDSDMPGMIIAQVSENVFDSATGKSLLIPQGSRLVGEYGSVVGNADRIRIGFRRLIFPDTSSIDLPQAPATDQAGYTGLTDRVNNHYLATFGAAAVMALISAGQSVGTMAAFNNSQSVYSPYGYQPPSQYELTAQSAGAGASGEMGGVGQQVIGKGLNRPLTIHVRPGFQFDVMLTADLVFNAPFGGER